MKRKIHLSVENVHYDPTVVEESIYALWEGADLFTAKPTGDKPSYSIAIPPPNVTGRLHMGHALNNTIQDLLIRYKRMDGFDVLWIPGTDHAGISTQSVVKKQLDAEGIDYQELGRERMVERIWQWKEKYGNQILLQLRRLGCSCDWSRTRFTMDEGLSKAVLVAFKRLYDEGLIYRGKYIVNWCPADKTALSDDEVLTKDGGEPGHLWHFKYPFADGDGFITIATTRPETILGDSAIAVNPKDERFTALIGRKVKVPLVDREIAVIADDFVDPEFGTGCVKVTPAHDPNDFQMGQRHGLQQINVMNEDATMSDVVPEPFRGLDRYQARKKIVEEFDKLGLLVKVEDRMVPVGRSYRSKVVIEYRLSDQWFVKMAPLAERALQKSKAGELKFYPERWDSFYRSWLENCRDWCISRQLWWGHRIPAWYHKETGEILVDVETPDKVKQNPQDWVQEEDVLDTWFSSALWPYSTLGWPDASEDFGKYYPTSVLVTGKDIIFFWVVRMVMTGLFNTGQMPFHKVLINSIICDEDGETMSKSKGNGIDPLHVIDGATTAQLEEPVYEARPQNLDKLIARVQKRFPDGFAGVGADALRYTMLVSSTDAQQMQISLKRFDEVGRPLTNKIWNASRLALSFFDKSDTGIKPAPADLTDHWLLGRLDKTVAAVRKGFDDYTLHHSVNALYHFFWDDVCDWYLEIAKLRLRGDDAPARERVLITLSEVFSSFLRLMHPIMPFITEELWGHFGTHFENYAKHFENSKDLGALCAVAPFPRDKQRFDAKRDGAFAELQEIVRNVRNLRAGAGISPKEGLECAIRSDHAEFRTFVEQVDFLIRNLANMKSLSFVEDTPENMSSAVLSKGQLFLNLSEFMDVEAELNRNQKLLEKTDKEIASLNQKLSNEQFTSRAPANIVEAEKSKLEDAKRQKEKLLAIIGGLSSS